MVQASSQLELQLVGKDLLDQKLDLLLKEMEQTGTVQSGEGKLVEGEPIEVLVYKPNSCEEMLKFNEYALEQVSGVEKVEIEIKETVEKIADLLEKNNISIANNIDFIEFATEGHKFLLSGETYLRLNQKTGLVQDHVSLARLLEEVFDDRLRAGLEDVVNIPDVVYEIPDDCTRIQYVETVKEFMFLWGRLNDILALDNMLSFVKDTESWLNQYLS